MNPATTDHVLATIDAALHDWETSDDAMRWAPDVEPDATLVIHPDDAQLNEVLVRIGAHLEAAWNSSVAALQRFMDDVNRSPALGPLLREAMADATAYDPRARVLELQRQRNTGPPKPRLDRRR